MNDPNGLIQWRGQYHMFYQYNPHGAYHDKIHWGHAVSPDLVHWEYLPIALSPSPDGPDAEGCWSGCAVDDNGIPTLLYTATEPQTVCLVRGSDDLLVWEKETTPVIAGPPPEIADQTGGHFRDPFVWRDSERWLMMIGSKLQSQGGLILLYESRDLQNWKYLRPVLDGDIEQIEPFWTGTMWECPNLLDFGDKQAVIISAQATPIDHLFAFYFTGEFRQDRFHIESQHILVPTDYFYAPQVMRLDDGRLILFGWVREGRRAQSSILAGWAGVMSLPLECRLISNGKLGLLPARELQTLRGKHHSFADVGSNTIIDGIKGQALEILAQFEPRPNAEFGLKVRYSPNSEEGTRITVRENQVFIDRSQASLGTDANRNIYYLPIDIDDHISLRVFLDHSIIEVFINDQSYLVSRIYPTRSDSLGVGVFANGDVTVSSLDIWEMISIWKDDDK
jgi:beta-fructofuranosidase